MITNHCRIVNKTIVVDDAVIFRSNASTLDEFLLEAYNALKIDYPKFYKMDNLSKAGFLAAEMLLKKSPALNYPGEKMSLVLANAHASLDTDVKYAQASQSVPSPALFVYTLANIVAGEICIRHKIKGENAFFISQTFDAALFESYVSMIPADHLCLAGWVDVMGDHHDVFLYLQDNASPGKPHRASTLSKLYKKEYGTVNG